MKSNLTPAQLKSLTFHIESQDFHGYAATYITNVIPVLEALLTEGEAPSEESTELALSILKELREELIHLQYGPYKIITTK